MTQPNEQLIETIEKALKFVSQEEDCILVAENHAYMKSFVFVSGTVKKEYADFITNAPEWLLALLEENKRLETKYHVDMNNYRSQVQTWQQQYDSQIISLHTELAAKDKVLKTYETLSGEWDIGQWAREILQSYPPREKGAEQ